MPPSDPAVRRLLPDASRDDPEVAAEFRRLTEDDLRADKIARLTRLWAASTAPTEGWRSDAFVVDPADAKDVAASITDLRLVLAERLDIRTDEQAERLYDALLVSPQADVEDVPEVLDPAARPLPRRRVRRAELVAGVAGRGAAARPARPVGAAADRDRAAVRLVRVNDAPLGIFDSGVGGLTVARSILDQLPHESTLYIGDTLNTPYGSKPLAAVRAHALEVMDDLVDAGVKLLVIACNTPRRRCCATPASGTRCAADPGRRGDPARRAPRRRGHAAGRIGVDRDEVHGRVALVRRRVRRGTRTSS